MTQTTSERATASIQSLPQSERPISEEFRLVAKAWVDAEAAAQLLEDTKSSVLAQMIVARGEMSHNKAETQVKASEDWRNHIGRIVEARREANLRKVQMEFVRMRFSEWTATDANQRSERKMSR